MHSHNILHRDMSLSNLLITKDMHIVSTTDFCKKLLCSLVVQKHINVLKNFFGAAAILGPP